MDKKIKGKKKGWKNILPRTVGISADEKVTFIMSQCNSCELCSITAYNLVSYTSYNYFSSVDLPENFWLETVSRAWETSPIKDTPQTGTFWFHFKTISLENSQSVVILPPEKTWCRYYSYQFCEIKSPFTPWFASPVKVLPLLLGHLPVYLLISWTDGVLWNLSPTRHFF